MKGAMILAVVCAMLMATVANAGSSYTATISGDGISFVSGQNLTVDSGDHRFDYREVTFLEAVYFAFYASVEVQGEQTSSTSGSFDADAIVGAIMVPALILNPNPPAAYLLYFHAHADVDASGSSPTISGTASGSGVAVVYSALEEIDSNGNVVNSADLASVTWGSLSSGKKDGLFYAKWTASTSFHSDITFAAVGSSVTGILNIGGAAMTPKNAETIIEINQKSYASSGNHLRLTLYSAAASASATFSSTSATLISGSGSSQIYLHFANDATVDGNDVDVQVSGVAEASTHSLSSVGHSTIKDALSGNASLHVDVRKVTIDFPSGATMITYDPAQGFDAPKVYSAAGTATASVFAVAFSAALALLL